MDVLGHQDVGGDTEALLLSGLFEEPLDCVLCLRGAEEVLSLVTAEGDEMEELGLLEALEAGRHDGGRSLSLYTDGWGW
jgi:hypothetical protein